MVLQRKHCLLVPYVALAFALAVPASAASPNEAIVPQPKNVIPTPKAIPAQQTPQTAQPKHLLVSPLEQLPVYKRTPDLPENADLAYGAFQRGWYLTALALATKFAQNGDREAQTLIGVIYESGRGVAKDKAKAKLWYELAAKSGDNKAALRLGVLLLQGEPSTAEKQVAVTYLEQAAKVELPEALFNLALLYAEGDAVPQNLKKSQDLLERAAEAGEVEAMYQLALSYLAQSQDTSEIPEFDPLQAQLRGAFWMGRAARREHISAQVHYGTLLFKGEGVVPNESEAADWFQRAAEAGNPIAMNRLARLYANGRGRPIDLVEALAWQSHASALGIKDSELEELASSLSLEQQEDVLDRAKELAQRLMLPRISFTN
ncbi:tetratricopeptide repeat protein [Polycladidibacter hongkongensis]|uniref:tetratricopeptide repeat protein n=1 Tax=Polycladidibacter hongkongensis TaxID=1647556 RepID=UPI00082DE98A|nr:tetratricopeptide repeat protein [Pseudovibrio hongkongensis]